MTDTFQNKLTLNLDNNVYKVNDSFKPLRVIATSQKNINTN